MTVFSVNMVEFIILINYPVNVQTNMSFSMVLLVYNASILNILISIQRNVFLAQKTRYMIFPWKNVFIARSQHLNCKTINVFHVLEENIGMFQANNAHLVQEEESLITKNKYVNVHKLITGMINNVSNAFCLNILILLINSANIVQQECILILILQHVYNAL